MRFSNSVINGCSSEPPTAPCWKAKGIVACWNCWVARADLEDCSLQHQSLQDEARMLNLLLQTFEQEQAQLSESYSAPLSLEAYLRCFTQAPSRVGLRFDPRQGLPISIGNGIPALLGVRTSAAERGAPGCCRALRLAGSSPPHTTGVASALRRCLHQCRPQPLVCAQCHVAARTGAGVRVLLLSCDPNFQCRHQPDVLHHLPLKASQQRSIGAVLPRNRQPGPPACCHCSEQLRPSSTIRRLGCNSSNGDPLVVDGAVQWHLWIGELNASSGFLHHHQRLQAAAVAAHNQAPTLLAQGKHSSWFQFQGVKGSGPGSNGLRDPPASQRESPNASCVFDPCCSR